jgi:GAF domain-containing protein/HAMP domain-containing protein
MPENELPKKKLKGILNPLKLNRGKPVPFVWLSRSVIVITLLLTAYLIVFSIIQKTWQAFSLAGIFLLAYVVAIWIQSKFASPESTNGIISLSILVEFSLIVLSAFVKNVWVPAAILNLVFTFIISSVVSSFSKPSRWVNFIFPIGLITSVAMAIIGILAPLAQISNPIVVIGIYALMAVLLILYLYLLISDRVQAGLRIKLTSIFLAIALLPLVLVTVIQSVFLQNAIQNQANTALRLAAQQVSSSVDSFIQSNLDSVSKQASLSAFSNFLEVSKAGKAEGSTEKQEMVSTINTLRSGLAPYTPAYSVIDTDGKIIYDTNPQQINQVEINSDYFLQPKLTGRSFSSSVEFLPGSGNAYLYFSAPIHNVQGQFIGVLKVRYDALVLQKTLQKYVGLLGTSSFPVLFDENNIRLADTITPNLIYKSVMPLASSTVSALVRQNKLPSTTTNYSTNLPALNTALENSNQTPNFTADVYPDQSGNLQVGSIVKLSNQPWKVVFLESQASILSVRDQQLRVSTLIAIAIAATAGIIGTIVSIVISDPISRLTSTAEKIASGDLQAQAVIKTRDEIETLATAFNLMTSQLRGFIGELENRVTERTKQLAQQNEALLLRGRQLQTVADVARGITQTQELESLLNKIVTLISERFGFYHVGVFLVDEQKNYAVLRAANSEGGHRMLARHHQLQVGQIGIVGYVTAQGKPRIATDVGQDAVYFSNPDLPQTKSEMALPLSVGENIIGALDVQSTKSNAFTEEDIGLFSTLADQVAIAIYNNQLFGETSKALEEAQKVHRQYLEQQWTKEASTRLVQGYQYTPEGIRPISDEEQQEVQDALIKGEPIVMSDSQSGSAPVLAVPIRVRGETIGVIHLEETSGSRTGWSPDEIETIKNVSDQIGLALENARLFEQTVRRAERERKVLEITSKIRSTTDPKAMLEIARVELQRALQAKSKNAKPETGNP